MRNNRLVIVFIISVATLLTVSVLFFYFTSAISKPDALSVYLPKQSMGETEKINTAKAKLTLLLIDDSTIYTYIGSDVTSAKKHNYKTIREEINKNKHLLVVIKPTEKASYKNTVDILDEMTINGVKTFVMQDVSKTEKRFLKQLNII